MCIYINVEVRYDINRFSWLLDSRGTVEKKKKKKEDIDFLVLFFFSLFLI